MTPTRKKTTAKKAAKKAVKKPVAAVKKSPTVTASMNVMEIIALHPITAEIMAGYGLHCFSCSFNTIDSLEAGARSHGLDDADIENMVKDLNDALKDAPPRPATLTVTEPAATSILGIAKAECKEGHGLTVIAEEGGGFCMEFNVRPEPGAKTFTNKEVPEIRIFASMQTLGRIGGATIDFREGRFKLDLPEAAHTCACDGGVCKCSKKKS
jgi:hybrid cluster-associated redox disulfide protein